MGPTAKTHAAVWASMQLQFLEAERKRQAVLAAASAIRPRLVEATLQRSASALAQNRSALSSSSASSPSSLNPRPVSVSAGQHVDEAEASARNLPLSAGAAPTEDDNSAAANAEPLSVESIIGTDTVDHNVKEATRDHLRECPRPQSDEASNTDVRRHGHEDSSSGRRTLLDVPPRRGVSGSSVGPSEAWRRGSATFSRRGNGAAAAPGPAPGTAAYADMQCKQLVQEIECRLSSIAQLDDELEALTQRSSQRVHPPVAAPSSRLYPAQPRSASSQRGSVTPSPQHHLPDGDSRTQKVLSTAEVTLLANRLCPPLKDFQPPPPLDRTVRANVKRTSPAAFSDDTAVRLGTRDPEERRKRQLERIAKADRDAKIRVPRCKEEDRQETCVRNYEFAKLAQSHRDAAEARVIDAIDRTCNRTIPARVLPLDVLEASVARLSRESETVRSRREKLIATYADNYVAVGTAAEAHRHKAPLSHDAAARLYDGLSKGFDFHWRFAAA